MKDYENVDDYLEQKACTLRERKYFASFNNLSEIKEYVSGRDLIIYGAGQMGRAIYKKFKAHGINATEIWDTNADEINPQYISEVFPIDKVVTTPNPSCTDYNKPILIVAIGDREGESICRKYWEKGVRDIFFDHDELCGLFKFCCVEENKNSSFKFDLNVCLRCIGSSHDNSGGYNGFCDIFQKELLKLVGIDPAEKIKNVMGSLALVVTTRCTLNCEKCGVDLGGPDGVDFPVDQIVSDVKKLADAVDFINMIGPVGGEMLLYKNLYELLVELEKIPNLGLIILSTNGTVPLKDERFYELISSPRFSVRISSYEGIVSDNIQKNVKKFVEKLDEHRVAYKYHRVGEWYDYTDWSYRNFSKERLARQESCYGRGFYLYDGILTNCAVSLLAGLNNKMPLFKEDQVYLRELSCNEILKRIRPFLDPFNPRVVFNSCGYCDGAASKIIPVANQAKHR